MKIVNLIFLKIKIFKKKSTRCRLKIHVVDLVKIKQQFSWAFYKVSSWPLGFNKIALTRK